MIYLILPLNRSQLNNNSVSKIKEVICRSISADEVTSVYVYVHVCICLCVYVCIRIYVQRCIYTYILNSWRGE